MGKEQHVCENDHGMLLCLTAFSITVRHITGRDDFLVEFPVSLRDLDVGRLGGVMGPLTNTSPLRIDTVGATSFVDVFLKLAKRVNCLRAHVVSPFSPVQRRLGLQPFSVKVCECLHVRMYVCVSLCVCTCV